MTTPNETPTPRTDALQNAFNEDDKACAIHAFCEMAEHARTLEMELNRANEEAENWKAACECEHQDKVWQLEKLAEAKAEIERLKEALTKAKCIYCGLVVPLSEAAQLADHILSCEKSPVVQMAIELQLRADNAEKQVAELREEVEKAYKEGAEAVFQGVIKEHQSIFQLWTKSRAKKVAEGVDTPP